MEDKKIKSALEIAMERMASIPGLTKEELATQKEREYQPRGAATARRYLQGLLKERDLQTELSKYQGQEGEIVKRAFLLALKQSINLDSKSITLKALDGISAVVPIADLDETKKKIEVVFDEFGQQLEQKVPHYEALEKGRLQQLGISGSAVRPNLEESQAWQEELRQIQSEFDLKLTELKENLLPH